MESVVLSRGGSRDVFHGLEDQDRERDERLGEDVVSDGRIWLREE